MCALLLFVIADIARFGLGGTRGIIDTSSSLHLKHWWYCIAYFFLDAKGVLNNFNSFYLRLQFTIKIVIYHRLNFSHQWLACIEFNWHYKPTIFRKIFEVFLSAAFPPDKRFPRRFHWWSVSPVPSQISSREFKLVIDVQVA